MAKIEVFHYPPEIYRFAATQVPNPAIRHPRTFLEISTLIARDSGILIQGVPNTTTVEDEGLIRYYARSQNQGSVEGDAFPRKSLVFYTVTSTGDFDPEDFADQIKTHLSPREIVISAASFAKYHPRTRENIINFADFK